MMSHSSVVAAACLFMGAAAAADGAQTKAPPRRPIDPAKMIRWVRIPGGTFMMGTSDSVRTREAKDMFANAKPVHRVALRSFEMSKTLVTNRQYAACVAAGACAPQRPAHDECSVWDETRRKMVKLPARFMRSNQPAVCVNWDQAQAFAKWVGGRLPSEAQWEYAARSAGKDYKYPWGNAKATCVNAVMGGCGLNATAPVCSRPSGNTAQGLCDMAGNVWEWAEDWYHDSYQGAPSDGSAWVVPPSNARVIRGGSWADDANYMRSALHYNDIPSDRNVFSGFRVVR